MGIKANTTKRITVGVEEVDCQSADLIKAEATKAEVREYLKAHDTTDVLNAFLKKTLVRSFSDEARKVLICVVAWSACMEFSSHLVLPRSMNDEYLPLSKSIAKGSIKL